MSHTIWHEDTLLGTIALPHGRFVAGRLRPAAGYLSIAETVQRSTHAFLHLGLFYRDAAGRKPLPDADQWLEAIEQASGLRLTLVDSYGGLVATHFINLLDSVRDDGVVALVSLEDDALARPAMIAPQTPPPRSFTAPAG